MKPFELKALGRTIQETDGDQWFVTESTGGLTHTPQVWSVANSRLSCGEFLLGPALSVFEFAEYMFLTHSCCMWDARMPPRDPWSDKVTALLAQFPGPVTLHPSNRKLIAFVVPLAIGDGFIIHGLWSTLPRLSGKALVMVGGFLVVPVLLLIFLAAMTYWQHLRLDIEGIEFRFAFGRIYRMRWSEIARFGSFFFLAVHLDSREPCGHWDRFQRAYLAGDYIFWVDTFGLGAKGFVRLMNAWRDRALAEQHR